MTASSCVQEKQSNIMEKYISLVMEILKGCKCSNLLKVLFIRDTLDFGTQMVADAGIQEADFQALWQESCR